MQNRNLTDYYFELPATYSKLLSSPETLPFSKIQEENYLRRMLEGDKRAREELITRNLRFVVKIANRYGFPAKKLGIDFFDLVEEGNLGLIEALDNFEAHYIGLAKVTTFAAKYIRGRIYNALGSLRSTLSCPQHIDPFSLHMVSFNAAFNGPFNGDAEVDLTLEEVFPDSCSTGPLENVASADDIRRARELIFSLDEKDRRILEKRYGAAGKKLVTFKKIAETENLTPQRVHKRNKRNLNLLRALLD